MLVCVCLCVCMCVCQTDSARRPVVIARYPLCEEAWCGFIMMVSSVFETLSRKLIAKGLNSKISGVFKKLSNI